MRVRHAPGTSKSPHLSLRYSRGQFRKVAQACGLVGSMKRTKAGDELKARLQVLIDKIGAYPHAQLIAASPPKRQGNRHLKLVCNNCECGMIVQTTRVWLDKVGPPFCRCGGVFEETTE
jgi:hypothetical protein